MGEQKTHKWGPLSVMFTPVWPGIQFGIQWQRGPFVEVVLALGLVYVSLAKAIPENDSQTEIWPESARRVVDFDDSPTPAKTTKFVQVEDEDESDGPW